MKTNHLLIGFIVLSVAVSSMGAPLVVNGSFEEPQVPVERGLFEGWDFLGKAGTGTWPVSRVDASGEADGNQVAVVAPGGFIGQIVKTETGEPVRIVPGTQFEVRFINLPHNKMNNVNMGIYLQAGSKDGGRIAEAVPFKKANNVSGEYRAVFTVYPEAKLNTAAPGWQTLPVYLMFRGFVDRVVLDDVRVGLVKPDGSTVYSKNKPAAPRSGTPAPAAPAVSAAAGTIAVANASFESPSLTVERGSFEGWDFLGKAGTGTWPVSRADATGEADGSQVAVVHGGGFIGQVLKNAAGKPLRVVPGTRMEVRFRNLPHTTLNNVNMGIYLLAGSKDGGRVAEAVPFKKENNVPGEYRTVFTVYPAEKLNASAKGWQTMPVYLMFRGFADRVVMDDVQVRILK